jgi:hypothetical protein
VGQHDCELVATKAGAGIAEAHFIIDALRNFAQHGIAGEVSVLVIDALEVIDIDHQARNGLMIALRPCQLLAQPGVQIAAIVETGEKVGQAAAHQPGTIHGVLQADRGHDSQVSEEIGGQLPIEAEAIGAREHQHPIQLAAAAQGNQREAAVLPGLRDQQLVIRHAEGPEPRPLEVAETRRDGGQHIDELHLRELLEQEPVTCKQMAYLVIGVVQDQCDRIELIRGAQSMDQPFQQLRKRPGSQQLELALLGLAQKCIVTADLIGELSQASLQRAHFGAQLTDTLRVRGVTF